MRDGIAWQRIPLGAKVLEEKVKALREGLDLQDAKKAAQSGKLFNLGLAHDLYKTVLGPVANLIDDKRHLLIVPSGVLTGLPFHLLVTEPPATPIPRGSRSRCHTTASRRRIVAIVSEYRPARNLGHRDAGLICVYSWWRC
jgi:hypothetical protein